MPNDLVLVREELPIAIVELNRKEKRNALSAALRDQLEAALGRLANDDRVKAVVLTGGDSFSAGFDLQELIDTDLKSLFHRGREFTFATYFFPKPLVCAVNGFALAGGFDLMLSGDVIVLGEKAKVGRPEIRWGINPLMTKLWHRVGMAKALQLTLRGGQLAAEEALRLGLADRVVPEAEVLATAIEEARAISEAPLSALVATKKAARTAPMLDTRAAIDFEFALSGELAADPTLRQILQGYAKKVGVVKKD